MPHSELDSPPVPALPAAALSAVTLALVGTGGGLLMGMSLESAATLGGALFLLPAALLAVTGLAVVGRLTAEAIIWAVERSAKRDITGDGYIGQPPALPEPERIRMVPYRTAPRERRLTRGLEHDNGYSEADFEALLSRAYDPLHGWTIRDYLGMTLPSGRRINQSADLEEFYSMLERTGLLVDRTERHKGQLLGTIEDAEERFGL